MRCGKHGDWVVGRLERLELEDRVAWGVSKLSDVERAELYFSLRERMDLVRAREIAELDDHPELEDAVRYIYLWASGVNYHRARLYLRRRRGSAAEPEVSTARC